MKMTKASLIINEVDGRHIPRYNSFIIENSKERTFQRIIEIEVPGKQNVNVSFKKVDRILIVDSQGYAIQGDDPDGYRGIHLKPFKLDFDVSCHPSFFMKGIPSAVKSNGILKIYISYGMRILTHDTVDIPILYDKDSRLDTELTLVPEDKYATLTPPIITEGNDYD